MKKATSAGGIIINKNKILLIHHNTIGWVFPKGHIEEGETEEQTAIREIKEETGLKQFKIIKKLGTIIRTSKEKTGEIVIKEIHLFLTTTEEKELNPEEECKWFTFEEAIKSLIHKEDKEFLRNKTNLLKTFYKQNEKSNK